MYNTYIVSMAGGAVKGDSILYLERRMIADAKASSSIVFDKNEETIKKCVKLLSSIQLIQLFRM